MGTPQFIVDLRQHIGHRPLWLMGANALVLRDGQVLLVRRADTGLWAPISGIVDPAEHPSVTAVREAREEASVEVEVERMLWSIVTEEVTYANGDVCQFLDHGFRCRWVSGEPAVGDEESTAVAWFPIDQLPAARQERLDAMIAIAVADPRDVVFSL